MPNFLVKAEDKSTIKIFQANLGKWRFLYVGFYSNIKFIRAAIKRHLNSLRIFVLYQNHLEVKPEICQIFEIITCYITFGSLTDTRPMLRQADGVDFSAEAYGSRQFQQCHVVTQMLHTKLWMFDDAGNFEDLPVIGSAMRSCFG